MTHWRASQLKSRPAAGQPLTGPYLRETQRNNVILFASNPEGKCAAVLTLASPQKLGEAAAIIQLAERDPSLKRRLNLRGDSIPSSFLPVAPFKRSKILQALIDVLFYVSLGILLLASVGGSIFAIGVVIFFG